MSAHTYHQIISPAMARDVKALAMARSMMEYELDKHITAAGGNPEQVEYRPFLSAVQVIPPFDDPRFLQAHIRLTLETV